MDAHAKHAYDVHAHVMHTYVMHGHYMHAHAVHAHAVHCMLYVRLTATYQLPLKGQNRFNSGHANSIISGSVLQRKFACR
jgi:hypothetical protein